MPRVRPRSMNRLPSVTMNEGSPVLTTANPFKAPIEPHRTKAKMIDAQMGQPQNTAGMAMAIPAKPIIDPTERSNSPAIINRVTGAARMPSCADTSRKLMMPLAENKPLPPATIAKKTKTRIVPATAPSSGRLSRRPKNETCLIRSSCLLDIMIFDQSKRAVGQGADRQHFYRLPCLESSITEAAVSLVTKPGPVG